MVRRDDISKTLILEKAQDRMMHYGVQKTSMQEIAKDAGIAVGTLYLHYKNKEEMVLAVAENCKARYQEQAKEILNQTMPADEKLKRFVSEKYLTHQALMNQYPHFLSFLLMVSQLDEHGISDCKRQFREDLAQIIQEGILQKRFQAQDAQNTAQVLFWSLQAFFPVTQDFNKWTPGEIELQRLLHWFIEQLKSQSGILEVLP